MPAVNIRSRLSEVIEDDPGAAQFLMELGVDCTACADRSVDEICRASGIDGVALFEALSESQNTLPDETGDWTAAPIALLVDHIVAVHHAFARRQLSRMQLLLSKAWRDHGDRLPQLRAIRDEFAQLRLEIEEHLRIEEHVLFPEIVCIDRAHGRSDCYMGPVDRPIAEIGHDFDEAAGSLARLRKLTHNFESPLGVSPAYQAFLQELSDLERDLERHAHLENQILFPRALALEKQLRGP